jgi:hypothetical protein
VRVAEAVAVSTRVFTCRRNKYNVPVAAKRERGRERERESESERERERERDTTFAH